MRFVACTLDKRASVQDRKGFSESFSQSSEKVFATSEIEESSGCANIKVNVLNIQILHFFRQLPNLCFTIQLRL